MIYFLFLSFVLIISLIIFILITPYKKKRCEHEKWSDSFKLMVEEIKDKHSNKLEKKRWFEAISCLKCNRIRLVQPTANILYEENQDELLTSKCNHIWSHVQYDEDTYYKEYSNRVINIRKPFQICTKCNFKRYILNERAFR